MSFDPSKPYHVIGYTIIESKVKDDHAWALWCEVIRRDLLKEKKLTLEVCEELAE